MAHSESSSSSSPANDPDISLPDAPPLKTEKNGTSTTTEDDDDDDNNNNNIHNGHVDLDNLFDADSADEDALVLSSAAVPSSSNIPSSSPPPATKPSQTKKAPDIDPQLMTQYYARLFPFRTLFHWLNHSIKPSPDFANREFAFTLSNDAYLRYQSYPTADTLRRDMLRLNPSRFEIGPVYTANPRDRKTLRKSTAFRPLAKELVFDIDLTDYDDVRTCCSKAEICSKCWKFVTMAVKVVDAALRQDFGFEHILWVYSGRRGAHAWVCDRSAREMDDEKRKAIAGYLEVVKGGGGGGGKRVGVKRPLHPHLVRSLDILKPYFQSIVLEEQNPFANDSSSSSSSKKTENHGSDRLLSLLPQDQPFLTALANKWSTDPHRSSTKKWSDLDTLASTGVSTTLSTRALRDAKQDILLEYTYARLDVEVSKKRIHLLKAPFVVHPGTGRVCVPITANAEVNSGAQGQGRADGEVGVDAFDPDSVPTVEKLVAEVDAYADGDNNNNNNNNNSVNGVNGTTKDDDKNSPDNDIMAGFTADTTFQGKVRKMHDWEKTSLKPYIHIFDSFVKNLLRAELRGKRMRETERDGDGDGPVTADGRDLKVEAADW